MCGGDVLVILKRICPVLRGLHFHFDSKGNDRCFSSILEDSNFFIRLAVEMRVFFMNKSMLMDDNLLFVSESYETKT